MSSALFYSGSLSASDLRKAMAGRASVLPKPFSFDSETGGAIARNLGMPFLAGMDAVRITSAQLGLRIPSFDRETTPKITDVEAGMGKLIDLGRPDVLTAFELAPTGKDPSVFQQYLAGATAGGVGDEKTMRLVVRPAALGGDNPYGPPAFVNPPLPPVGTMYQAALDGISPMILETGNLKISLPRVSGRAWLVQFSQGAEAKDLASLAFAANVVRVWVEEQPQDLTLVVTNGVAGDEIVLWTHPGVLPAGTDVGAIDFLAVAQRQLAARFADAAKTSPTTLALPLELRCQSAAKIDVTAQVLDGHYEANAIAGPVTISLGGAWAKQVLDLPGGRRPTGSSLKVRLRHLGRAVNGGSVPSAVLPTRGVRLTGERQVARGLALDPLPGAAPGSPVPVVAARVCLAADLDSEAVLSLCQDAAGGPGALVAAPVVVTVKAKTRDWIEFPLATPITLTANQPRLWVILRRTRGEIFWLAEGAGDVRASDDKGKTWAPVEPALVEPEAPLLQILHVEAPPAQVPAVTLALGSRSLTTSLMIGLAANAPGEWGTDTLSLPAALLDVLGQGPGPERRPTEVLFYSRVLLDLSIESAIFTYDPYTPGREADRA
jgi:hypothetical protein